MVKKNKKVLVAMSGGVDSSTAAKILVKKGYQCIGVFMRLGICGSCCDEGATRRVCQKLGIRFYPVDLSHQFKKEVKDYFLDAYQRGLTPNPCVACNKFIKFGELLKIARKLGCYHLATGHYVKLKKIGKKYKIYRPADKKKDQTYFLYNLTQESLKHILFPLGDFKKEKIREEADKEKLPCLKKESQDICFLPGDHNVFLKDYIKPKKGPIKTLSGKKLSEHKGLPFYTIGQRKGIEIGGTGPYYAVRADYKTNTLYVTKDSKEPALFRDILKAKNVNWLGVNEPKYPLNCQAVIRYRHKEVPCVVKSGKKSLILVKFESLQRAITPGQSVVFYKGSELLGGGIIS